MKQSLISGWRGSVALVLAGAALVGSANAASAADASNGGSTRGSERSFMAGFLGAEWIVAVTILRSRRGSKRIEGEQRGVLLGTFVS